MKVILNTDKFKNLTGRVVKGAGNQNDALITSSVTVEVKDKTLSLMTTAGNHTMKVWLNDATKEEVNFATSLNADKLTRLTRLTTVDKITLFSKDEDIIFEGNGVYTLAQLLDEEGNLARVPELEYDEDTLELELTVPTKILKKALNFNKLSVGLNVDVASYGSAYYLTNEHVLTYDDVTSVMTKGKMTDKPFKLLINSEVMDLIENIQSENTKIKVYKNVVKFIGDDIELTALVNDRVSLFPEEALLNTYSSDYDYLFTVSRSDILEALDRLSIFLEIGEKNKITMIFNDDQLLLSSNSKTGNEMLYSKEVIASENPYIQAVDLLDLKRHITSHSGETIKLRYGNDRGLLIENNEVTHLLPYYDSEEDEEDINIDIEEREESTLPEEYMEDTIPFEIN